MKKLPEPGNDEDTAVARRGELLGAEEGESEALTCPECGISMEGIDPRKHAVEHWPLPINEADPRTELARKRKAELLSFPSPRRTA